MNHDAVLQRFQSRLDDRLSTMQGRSGSASIARLPKSQQHNETARRLHGEWLASLGVIPPQADLDQRLGYATRLKDSVLLATGFTAAPAGNKSKRRSLQARSSAGRGSA